jgi:hypothetical protein
VSENPGFQTEVHIPIKSETLIDATTLVRAREMTNSGTLGFTHVLALSNLVDSLVLFDSIATLPPVDPEDDSFRTVIDDLGIHPELYTISEETMNRVVNIENNARDLEFGVIRWNSDGEPRVPAKIVDPVVIPTFHAQFHAQSKEGTRLESPSLNYRLSTEVKKYFRSIYNSFLPEGEQKLVLSLLEPQTSQYPFPGLAYLSFRTDLYMALAGAHNVPYMPDALRSSFILGGTTESYRRLLPAAKIVLRNLDASVDQRRAELNRLTEPLAAASTSTPSVLAYVLSRASSKEKLVDEAIVLAKDRSAGRFRTELLKLQEMILELPANTDAVRGQIERLSAVSEAFVRETTGDRKAGTRILDSQQFLLQGFVSVLGAILTGVSTWGAAGATTLNVLSSLSPTRLRDLLLRRSLAFLKDPILEANAGIGVQRELSRLFGKTLSDQDLLVLRSLRGLRAQ